MHHCSQDDGDIVECDWCGISVHEGQYSPLSFVANTIKEYPTMLYNVGCYGVPEEDGVDQNRSSLSSYTTIPWFCDACKAGLTPTFCVSQLSHYSIVLHGSLCSIARLIVLHGSLCSIASCVQQSVDCSNNLSMVGK